MPRAPDFLFPAPDDDVIQLPSRRELRVAFAFFAGLPGVLALNEWRGPDVAVRFFTAAITVGVVCELVFMALALRVKRRVGANPPTATLLLICAIYLLVFGFALGIPGLWLLQWVAGTDPFFADPDHPAARYATFVAVLAPPLDMLWRHWHLQQLRAAERLKASTADAGKLRELERIAFTDTLTGLPNRRQFEQALQRACDGQDGCFAVMFFDFDRFKQINDRHGHAVGDEFLVAVAGRLSLQLRREDLAARLGGDEFAVLVRGGDVRQVAAAIGEGFARVMTEPFKLQGVSLRSSASIGIALGRAPGASLPAVLHAADLAMYRAKAAGGARHVFADAEDAAEAA